MGLLVAACLACLALAAAQQEASPVVSDLTGPGWAITNTNGSIRLNAAVPVYALEALHATGRVAAPLDR